MEKMGKYLEGPTALIYSWDSPSAAAKIAREFAKGTKVQRSGWLSLKATSWMKGRLGLCRYAGQGRAPSNLLATFVAPPPIWFARSTLVRRTSCFRRRCTEAATGSPGLIAWQSPCVAFGSARSGELRGARWFETCSNFEESRNMAEANLIKLSTSCPT